MKLKNIDFDVTYRNVEGDTGEAYYGCGLEFKINKKTAKEMVAGMTDREKETFRKVLEESPLVEKDSQYYQDIEKILAYLSYRTGKPFESMRAGKKTKAFNDVLAILKKGFTVAHYFAVIDKLMVWGFSVWTNYQYVRPSTIRSKFDEYWSWVSPQVRSQIEEKY